MPLSKMGMKVLRRFKKKYGKEKGEEIFYSWKNKNQKHKGVSYD